MNLIKKTKISKWSYGSLSELEKRLKVNRSATRKQHKVMVLFGDLCVVKSHGENSYDVESVDVIKKALGAIKEYDFIYVTNHKSLMVALSSAKPEFVLNFCDKGYNNNINMRLHIPACLEMFEIPYSGPTPDSFILCNNRSIVRGMAATLNIPVPEEICCAAYASSVPMPTAFPVILKPNLADSSFGIAKEIVVSNACQLRDYVQQMPATTFLIQEFVPGDQYSVLIIGNAGNYKVLPILKIKREKSHTMSSSVEGYDSKRLSGSESAAHVLYEQANLDQQEVKTMSDYAIAMFERSCCRDYALFDFCIDSKGNIKLLGVDPNPGWGLDSALSFMAKIHGMTYVDMLRLILKASMGRYKFLPVVEQQPLVT